MGRGAWMDAIQVLSCDRLGWQSESILFMSTSSPDDSYTYSNSWITHRRLGFLCAICVESR